MTTPAARVTVDLGALDALIGFADQARTQRDMEFCCSTAEFKGSDREFEGLVAALDRADA